VYYGWVVELKWYVVRFRLNVNNLLYFSYGQPMNWCVLWVGGRIKVYVVRVEVKCE